MNTSIRGMVMATAIIASNAPQIFADSFKQTNLVSDSPGVAAHTDPNLINPWGMSFSPTSPIWVSNQGTTTSTLYDGAGNINALVVTVPPTSGLSTGPTGQVFAGGTDFRLNGNPVNFIFATLSGSIDAWNGGTTATVVASTPGAGFTGLAILNNTLYAANPAGNTISAFDSSFNPTTLAGNFVDPNAQPGFTPFNVQTIGSELYVTFAQLGPGGSPMPGGYVDVFDASGNFIRRAADGASLYAPWGVVIAPSNFGSYSNDLLIGNFGNGKILAYDPLTRTYLGTLTDDHGNSIANSGLWALATRTGGTNSDLNAVYFTAGIGGEQHGLLGKINVLSASPIPEPASLSLFATGVLAGLGVVRRKYPTRSR